MDESAFTPDEAEIFKQLQSSCDLSERPATRRMSVGARLIKSLLLGQVKTEVGYFHLPEQRLGLQHLDVTGILDLSGVTAWNGTPLPSLILKDCWFRDTICLAGSHLRSLSIAGSKIVGVNARGVTLQGRLDFRDIGALDPSMRVDVSNQLDKEDTAWIDLTGAHVSGEIIGNGATLKARSPRPPDQVPRRERHFALKLAEVRVDGSIFLEGLTAIGGLDVISAKIQNDLRVGRGTVTGGEGPALRAIHVEIGGACILGLSHRRRGPAEQIAVAASAPPGTPSKAAFEATGLVTFAGAKIGQDFICRGGHFANASADGQSHALDCEHIRVGGAVLMDCGFAADGIVRLSHAEIAGNVALSGGTFKNAVELKENPPRFENALTLGGARVGGVLRFSERFDAPNLKIEPARIEGSVNLRGARVATLADDDGLWAPNKAFEARNQIGLDGLVYDRLDSKYLSGAQRIAWLQRQPAKDKIENFHPQPYQQAAQVLRAMGHEAAAREVGIARHWDALQADWTADGSWTWLRCARRAVVGYVTNFGYARKRIAGAFVVFWLVGSWVYSKAEEARLIGPASPIVFTHTDLRKACGRDWTNCGQLPKEHTTFNAWVFSLDVMLPILTLGQDRDWSPIYGQPCAKEPCTSGTYIDLPRDPPLRGWFADILRIVYWAQTLAGWVISFLCVALLTGALRRD